MEELKVQNPPRETERGVRFDLSGLRRTSVESFRLAEIDGNDRKAAAARAATPREISDELLAQSITEVDDQPVERPYYGFNVWSSRTKELVEQAWTALNSATEQESRGFLDKALGAPPKASESPET